MTKTLNDEKLVSVSMYPEKIIAYNWYHKEMLPGSLPDVYVREGVYEALLRAAESLPSQLRLIVWDGYRTYQLQSYLYECLFSRIKATGLSDEDADKKTSIYVAYPSKDDDNVSFHLTGGAVDVTLADNEGHYLPMGGDFDDTEERSRTDYYDNADYGFKNGDKVTPSMMACWNRRTLKRVMTEAGFCNYSEEFWHYSFYDRNWAKEKGYSGEVYHYIEPAYKWR